MKILDLFSCAGGAAAGYARAGFTVVGVDIDPQPRYPYEFHQMDAIEFLQTQDLSTFNAIHASPPCQGYTSFKSLHLNKKGHKLLIPAMRGLLEEIGKPYIIENVMGAKSEMIDPVMLCGQTFGLGVTCRDGEYRPLQRHRLFESNIELATPTHQPHIGQALGIYGGSGGGAYNLTTGKKRKQYVAYKEEASSALEVDWMNWKEMTESIPPAYTEYLGHQLVTHIDSQSLSMV